MVTGANRHPADQLAEVRAEIENLKAREKVLRTFLLENEKDRRGEQRLDSAAAKNHLGELLDPFFVTSTFTTVRLIRVIGSVANGFPSLAWRSNGANAVRPR
jgi:hypothetical protein